MPKLSIDGREVVVADGATILDAAQQLEIEIPTLCFLRGYQPSTSCQVCLVKDRRSGRLWPSCATKVVEGMEIDSETAEVHAVRRAALELLLSDHAGDCRAPCWFACPAHMDIPVMLREIDHGELATAIATIKRDIALPAILGRVCPKPCEKGCRRCGADDAVAVCDLKRFVADQDLAAADPYLPPCKPSSGKRVAVFGGGPTGLAAVYYLRQAGHACVMFEKRSELGGRLRTETGESELPRRVLEDEIRQVLRLDVAVHLNTGLTSQPQLEQACREFDAVLVACGAVAAAEADLWGLKAGRKGIEIDRRTFATSRAGVFAAGNAIRGKGLVVRSVADGKEAAWIIDQYLYGQTELGLEEVFSSRMGQVDEGELGQFLAQAGTASRHNPTCGTDYTPIEAVAQAERCLGCDCPAHGKCKLEYYAVRYRAEPARYAGARSSFEVLGRPGGVQFEPGKCIKCELCIQIAERAAEPLGLAFIRRGFDVRLTVPFQRSFDEGLSRVAQQCIDACPTGALSPSRRTAVEGPT